MRLELILRGPRVEGARALAVRDSNYADRIGWRKHGNPADLNLIYSFAG